MAWTTVSKPGAQTWTANNPVGKEQYDDSLIEYDESTTYYDSLNYQAWTNVQSPTVAWNLDRATLSYSADVSAQTTYPEYAFFSPDGVYMYVGNGTTGDDVIQYTLSTPWDLSTKTYTRTKNLSLVYVDAIFFKPDGLKMYALVSSDTLREYDLSTAWDISTATFLQSYPISSGLQTHTGMYFSPDGLSLYAVSDGQNRLDQFSLTRAWDVSTMSPFQQVSISTYTTSPDGIYFKDDGKKLFITQYNTSSKIFEFGLDIPWNISSIRLNDTFVVSASDIDLFSVFFKPDGLHMYLAIAGDSTIKDYAFTGTWTNVAKPT